MKKLDARNSLLASKLGIVVAAAVFAVTMATVGLARSSARAANAAADTGSPLVLGMAFDGHQVANLDTTVKFYETLGYPVASRTDWKVDKIANELGGTKGAQSRTAIINMPSSVSDKPFPLILREYRGIPRQDWSKLNSAALGAGHMDVTVLDDCRPVMDKLKAVNMLRRPSDGISAWARERAPRRFVFVQDPDGWFIELFAKIPPAPGAPPEGPKVSNSSATQQNIERLGKQAGFNHIGLNVIDPAKALSFYQGVLGGDYPPLPPPAAGRQAAKNDHAQWLVSPGDHGRKREARIARLASKQGQATSRPALCRYQRQLRRLPGDRLGRSVRKGQGRRCHNSIRWRS